VAFVHVFHLSFTVVDSALCNEFILFKDKAKPRAKEVYCKGLKLSNLVTSSVIN